MRRALKIGGYSLLGIILFLLVAVLGLVVTLNTGAGREFAAREINSLSGGAITITRLSGHFPNLIAARRITIADRQSVYLTIDDPQLRWSIGALLGGRLDVTSLTARRMVLTRLPSQGAKPSTQKSSSGISLPFREARIATLRIDELDIEKQVFGAKLALEIHGRASLHGAKAGDAVISARSLDGTGTYELTAGFDGDRVNGQLAVQETGTGPIGRLAGLATNPEMAGPLDINAHLAGPRSDARLDLTAAIGPIKASAKGSVDLSEQNPGADIIVDVPDIAPVASLGGQPVTGDNTMHLVVKHHGASTDFHIDDALGVTGGKGAVPQLIGPKSTLLTDFTLAGSDVTIHRFTLATPSLQASLSGSVGKQIDLTVGFEVPNLGLFNPALSGHLAEIAKLTGPRDDLHLLGTLTGSVATAKGRSNPLKLVVDLRNLPGHPHGTVQGSGELLGAPITLQSEIARAANGVLKLNLHALRWQSLDAAGSLAFLPPKPVPTGTLHIAFAKLAELDPLVGASLAGAISADFTHQTGQPIRLTIDAKSIRVERTIALDGASIEGSVQKISTDPLIQARLKLVRLTAPGLAGDIDASVDGTMAGLAAQAEGVFGKLGGAPARARIAGKIDANSRLVALTHLSATSRGVNLELQKPAEISMAKGFSVRHMLMGVSGYGAAGTIAADGTITPNLDLAVEITRLPAALVRVIDPKIAAIGTIDARSRLTGTLAAPSGSISLDATGLGVTSGPGAKLPSSTLTARETLDGKSLRGTIKASLGGAKIDIEGAVPLSLTGPLDLSVRLASLSAALAGTIDPAWRATGTVDGSAKLTGTPKEPRGTIALDARGLRLTEGAAASLPPIDITARETLLGRSIQGRVTMDAGAKAHLALDGTAPLDPTARVDLGLTGHLDLTLLNPITEAEGTRLTGKVTPNLRIGGTIAAPDVRGDVTLADASVQNIASGLHLSRIAARFVASGPTIDLAEFSADAGKGRITGTGSVRLANPMPVDLRLHFDRASPIQSDLISEVLGGDVDLSGSVRGGLALGGTIVIESADLNIPQGLPPSVAKLTILRPGEKLPPPPAPPPPFRLDLTIIAKNRIFIRGHGISANLGGRLHLRGTASAPEPTGGLELIRGTFDLGGKSLQFTKGTIAFDGSGLMPVIDLEATHDSADGTSSTLSVTGTPTAPKIKLSSSPYLPSDEVLAHLLYGTGTQNLSPMQAASLAASLAQLAGIGGGGPNPLGSIRSALGLDVLSIGGGSGASSAPTINAGSYVAPGVYVGAEQSAGGQGSKVKVEVNLFKGLKGNATVSNGTGSGTSEGESVGLSYQFDY